MSRNVVDEVAGVGDMDRTVGRLPGAVQVVEPTRLKLGLVRENGIRPVLPHPDALILARDRGEAAQELTLSMATRLMP